MGHGSAHPDAHHILTAIATPRRGDDAVERFAALAGESVDTDRNADCGALEYGSRGDSGATVVAKTSALREEFLVVGEAQVVGTWNDTARAVTPSL